MLYLVDANLPYYFSLWHSEEYLHVNDLDPSMSDTDIWQYAKINKLTIITKDADFSHLIATQVPPPKVIHIRLRNMRVKELFHFLSPKWEEILKVSKHHKLVNVTTNSISAIK